MHLLKKYHVPRLSCEKGLYKIIKKLKCLTLTGWRWIAPLACSQTPASCATNDCMSSVTFISHRMIIYVTSLFMVAVLRVPRFSTVNNCKTNIKFNKQHLLHCLKLLGMS